MYHNSITLELFRYLEMIEDIKKMFGVYSFSMHNKHALGKPVHAQIKRHHEPKAHKEERKHRRTEEENKVREEKEAFDAIEKIREKEHHGF
ncbi:MAG: hypothetical protein RL292_639 [Candidatus Parcubacteria bacterium]